jgi:hypothetical protein
MSSEAGIAEAAGTFQAFEELFVADVVDHSNRGLSEEV